MSKIANGWVWIESRKAMFEYREGIEIGRHWCSKKYSHDVYECGKKVNL